MTMNAVVVYEDRGFAERAEAILRRVGERLEVNFRWAVSCWPLDALNEDEFASKMLEQAQDTNLILLPAKLAQSIPLRLMGWLDRWAALRHNSEVAVGLLGNSDRDRGETFVHPIFWSFAQKHQLTLIRNGGHGQNRPQELCIRFQSERKSAGKVEICHRGDYDKPGGYRRFGINE